MNRNFYYVRHGQTDWNLDGKLQGLTDNRLNKNGIEQAYKANENMPKDVDLIVTSPLLRALETAAILAKKHNTPIHIEENFKERCFGSIEGHVMDDVRKRNGLSPDESITKALPKDAEQWPETLDRSKKVVSYWMDKYPEKTILFVGHGAVFRAVYELTVGGYLDANNAEIYHFCYENKKWLLGS